MTNGEPRPRPYTNVLRVSGLAVWRRLTSRGRRAPVIAELVAVGTLVLLASAGPASASEIYVPGAVFGSEGSGNGQFKRPTAVAVNTATEPLTDPAAGAVYVLDEGNDRVQRFDPAGTYLSQFNGEETPAKAFASPSALAVDNSGNALDPSAGDVYVVDSGNGVIDKFTSAGTYVGQLALAGAGTPFHEIRGIAVDPAGNLWVYQGESATIEEYSDAGNFIKAFGTGIGTRPGMAVDRADNIYVLSGEGKVIKFVPAGFSVGPAFGSEATDVAIVPGSEQIVVDEGTTIAVYEPEHEEGAPLELRETFPSEPLTESLGIGVSGKGIVYASEAAGNDIKSFERVKIPEVVTGSATGFTENGATVRGTINPEGVPLTSCAFEYGTEESFTEESQKTASCAQSPADIGEGSPPVPVSAALAGLQPNTLYHFRLVGANAHGAAHGADQTFSTVSKPSIASEALVSAQATGATVSAQINAGGLPTTYRVEYGLTTAYGAATSVLSVGAPHSTVGARADVNGLRPSTLYHFRFVATNGLGSARGGDASFLTGPVPGTAPSGLPDGRAYELVSPPSSQDVYVPQWGGLAKDTSTIRPYRASSDGSRVAYFGDPPAESGGTGVIGSGLGNAFVATRAASGWSSEDIQPPGTDSATAYTAFGSDLSSGIVTSPNTPGSSAPLTPDAPIGCNVLYTRLIAAQAFQSLFSSTETPGNCGHPVFAGETADHSRRYFETNAALTPQAAANPPAAGQADLYEAAGGELHLVNLVAGKAQPGASFGAPAPSALPEQPNFSNAISTDGSKVFWTDQIAHKLYVRKDGSVTAQVDASVGGGGEFQTATPSGATVFFTKEGALYSFDTGSSQTTLVSGGDVRGVAGLSADGSSMYFVAAGALASGATLQTCTEPASSEEQEEENVGNLQGHGCNLYVIHAGATKFVATLAATDNTELPGPLSTNGDWQGDQGARTASATSDGRAFVFMSRQPLTGYDNGGTRQGKPIPEVFRYEPESGSLICASCNPTGEPPSEPEHDFRGAFVTASATSTFMLRWTSEDGSRLFFSTEQSLLPQDQNRRQDVYEWEKIGTGSCVRAPGCLFLISSGRSSDDAYFVDASASGNDVFLTDRARLAPEHLTENVALFDARVGGGFPTVSAGCLGGCQSLGPARIELTTPSSNIYDGDGNLAPAPPPREHTGTCKKGFIKRHGRCVKVKRPSRCRPGFVKRHSKCVKAARAGKRAARPVKGRTATRVTRKPRDEA